MSSFYDELEQLIQRKRAEEEASNRQTELETRFDGFNQRLDSLTETLGRFVDSVQPRTPGADGEGEAATGRVSRPRPVAPPAPAEEETAEELAMERVTRLDVPRIYNGDDEPRVVKFLDADTGEERERPGRRKGHPVGFDVEPVTDIPPGNDGEGEAAA